MGGGEARMKRGARVDGKQQRQRQQQRQPAHERAVRQVRRAGSRACLRIRQYCPGVCAHQLQSPLEEQRLHDQLCMGGGCEGWVQAGGGGGAAAAARARQPQHARVVRAALQPLPSPSAAAPCPRCGRAPAPPASTPSSAAAASARPGTRGWRPPTWYGRVGREGARGRGGERARVIIRALERRGARA